MDRLLPLPKKTDGVKSNKCCVGCAANVGYVLPQFLPGISRSGCILGLVANVDGVMPSRLRDAGGDRQGRWHRFPLRIEQFSGGSMAGSAGLNVQAGDVPRSAATDHIAFLDALSALSDLLQQTLKPLLSSSNVQYQPVAVVWLAFGFGPERRDRAS